VRWGLDPLGVGRDRLEAGPTLANRLFKAGRSGGSEPIASRLELEKEVGYIPTG
jgi:hypothetical protein